MLGFWATQEVPQVKRLAVNDKHRSAREFSPQAGGLLRARKPSQAVQGLGKADGWPAEGGGPPARSAGASAAFTKSRRATVGEAPSTAAVAAAAAAAEDAGQYEHVFRPRYV